MREVAIETKVGVFAAVIILLIAWATIRVGDRTSVSGSAYEISAVFENATGLKPKAPVELAGVKIGVVKRLRLLDSRQAEVILNLSKEVRLPENSEAVLRTRGFLGETYVEIIPGDSNMPMLSKGQHIEHTTRTGDINSLISQFSTIASNIERVTSSLDGMIGNSPDYPINRVVANLDRFAEAIKDVTVSNQGNIDRIAENLAAMTDELREVVARGKKDVEDSMESIASITRKINEGDGTLGKLVNDDETVEKLNEAMDSLNQALGGFKTLETEVGYKAEFLTQTNDFKHYVDLSLRPSPDKALLLGLVSDPDPRASHVQRTTDVTVGANTTTVTTETSTIDRQKLRFSAQLAKKFYDLQLRGGIIESSGGFGLDYMPGPFGVHFSAYDFSTRFGQKPHLKADANINITRSFYLSAGADDILNPTGPRPEWFVGAGFRFIDDDIKSFLGTSSKFVK